MKEDGGRDEGNGRIEMRVDIDWLSSPELPIRAERSVSRLPESMIIDLELAEREAK